MAAAIERGDTDAQDIFEELEPIMAGTPYADTVTRLGDSLDAYDFDQALEQVGELDGVIVDS